MKKLFKLNFISEHKSGKILRTKFYYTIFAFSIMFLAFQSYNYADITIGTGTSNAGIPIYPYFGYTYSQMLYLKSEIGISGNITTLSFYFNGTSLSVSNNWTIYIGHTAKTAFSSTTDWIPVSSMTQVYNATFTSPTGPGWLTLDITDFAYNGTSNLVIAVDENKANYDASSNYFYSTSSTTGRSIYYYSDGTNPDPANPSAGTLQAYYANVRLGGISNLGCGNTFLGSINPSNCSTQNSNYTSGTIPIWSFYATIGTTYHFSLGSNSEDSHLRLYNSSYVQQTENDDNGPFYSGLPASLSWTCSSTGTYYISAAHHSCGYLSYSSYIKFWSTPAVYGSGSGNTITHTASWQNQAYTSGSLYWYRFSATSGATYDFSLCGNTEDSYIRIFDLNWGLIQSYDDNGPHCSGIPASASWTAPSTATYIISIYHYNCTAFTNSGNLSYKVVPGLWTGNINNDWNTAGNWIGNSVPTSGVAVTIPTSPIGGRWPHIAGGYSCGALTLQPGSFMYIDAGAYYLWVYGNIANSGTISCSGTYLDDISIRGGGSRTISGGTFSGVGFGIYDGTIVTASSNITTLNALYPSASTLTTNGYSVSVSGHIYNDGIINAGSSVINISGNYTHKYSVGTLNANTSTVVFNGSSISYIYDTPTFYNLTINNSAGVNLSGTASVLNYLTLTSGLFTNGTLLDNGVKSITPDNKQDFSFIKNKTDVNSNIITTVRPEVTKSGDIPISKSNLKNEKPKTATKESLRKSDNNLNSRDIIINTNEPKYSPDANNLTLGNGATIERVNGSLSAISPTFGTSVNVIYSGSTPVTTGAEIPTSETILNNLTINNTGGVTLNSNTNVNGILTLTDGLLKTGSRVLTTEGNIVNNSPGITRMIVLDDGTNLGTLKRKVANNQSYQFYVGDLRNGTNFTPVIVTFFGGTSSSSYLSLTMVALKDVNNSSITDYLKRSWTLTPTNLSSPSYTLDLYYVNGDINGTETNIWFGKLNSGVWLLLGQPTFSQNKFTSQTLTSFSTFTGGEQGALPVQISTFTSSVNGRNIKLSWSTEKEINNAGFEVERAEIKNGTLMFNKIGFIKGNGSTNTTVNYSFEDIKLNSGKYNYRLKQIDYNGNFEYHNLANFVEVELPTKFDLSQNYPNPFNPVTKINFDLPKAGQVSLKVYDILGKEVKTLVNEFKDAGYYNITFDASGLPSGVYFYRLSSAEFSAVKKLMVLK